MALALTGAVATAVVCVTALQGPVSASASTMTLSKRVVGSALVGRSVEGRRIMAYEKGTRSSKAARRVLIIGCIHGNEKAGIATANYMLRAVSVRSDSQVWIVPTMNPDGNAADTRQNAHGVDMNRNWPINWVRTKKGTSTYSGPRAASEPEVREMMAFMKRIDPDKVVVIHQPWAEVGYNASKGVAFQRSLAKGLGLPLQGIPVITTSRVKAAATDVDEYVSARATAQDNSTAPTSAPPSTKPTPTPSTTPTPTPTTPTVTAPGPGQLQPGGRGNSPTLSGWFNAYFPGTSVTIEYAKSPSTWWKTTHAGWKIMQATGAR